MPNEGLKPGSPSLAGRVALITGASQGIGESIAAPSTETGRNDD